MDIYLQLHQKRGGLGMVAVPQRIFGGSKVQSMASLSVRCCAQVWDSLWGLIESQNK